MGLIAFLVGRRAIVESRDDSSARSLDIGGVLGSGLALLTLTYALIEGNRYGWTSTTILGLLALAVASAAVFVRHERHRQEPMLDLSLFRERTFAAGNIVLILAGFGLFGVFFFLSLYLQGVLGLSALQGGLAFTPMAAVLIIASPLSAKLAERYGAAHVVASGMGVFALGLFLISRVDGSSDYLNVLPGLLLAALGSALTTPLTTAILAAIPLERAGVASGALNTSRELAGSLGIAVMGAILAARESDALSHGASASDAFVGGYSLALEIAALVLLAGAFVAFGALRPSRNRVSPVALEPTG